MKIICYQLMTQANCGTEEEPLWQSHLSAVTMPWNAANEEIARQEAYGGIYTVEDDGTEAAPVPSPEQRIAELEEALALLLSGVTE